MSTIDLHSILHFKNNFIHFKDSIKKIKVQGCTSKNYIRTLLSLLLDHVTSFVQTERVLHVLEDEVCT